MRNMGPPNPYGRPQNRWGQRALISTDPARPRGTGMSAVMVATQLFPEPSPWIVTFRYQLTTPFQGFVLDETAWSGVVSAEHVQTIRRGIDELGGSATDLTTLLGGIKHPSETLLAHSLEITVEFRQTAAVSMWVEIFAVPIDCFDPTLIVAPAGALAGWGTPVVVRVPANAASVQLAAANVNRRQFYIQNNSTQDLAVLFGTVAADFTVGSENWTFLLPGGANATYESPIGGYIGAIQGIWRNADAAGEALVTLGFF